MDAMLISSFVVFPFIFSCQMSHVTCLSDYARSKGKREKT